MTKLNDVSQIKKQLQTEAQAVELWLASCLADKKNFPHLPIGLQQAMNYSLLAGGKRIRPVLCIVTSRLFGMPVKQVIPFASAIECIHTYSLIHDDLPAMDDDDLRRGKPSNHKQFDEATAILAGDSLLTDAFAFMAGLEGIPAERLLPAILEIARAAGGSGMVGGQFLDMAYTMQNDITLDELAHMQALKTGALLRAACVSGALLAGAPAESVAAIAEYGTAIGSAFQIMDDILDITGTEQELGKSTGSDQEKHKTTYPLLLGLNASRTLAIERAQQAQQALAQWDTPDASLLKGLAAYIVNRVS